MEQNHASSDKELQPHQLSALWLRQIVLSLAVLVLILWGGGVASREAEIGDTSRFQIHDMFGLPIGDVELRPLEPDGTLKLGFIRSTDLSQFRKFEWWQLAEREDRSGYPRIDPQSGGSGLPGARGEDEDPAYYLDSDYANSELASLIFAEGKYWLMDRPTHDSGFRFESWLIERVGPKSIVMVSGVNWGITVKNGIIAELHHPEMITTRTRFDWAESLRISGFGSGWEIKNAQRVRLP